ncbi:MAG TPA: AbfB domain-containing protein [Polyangiaceae bacterium]|nr:AbfB domain-containing protein [Polyangiaceae bacterium]
MQRFWTRSWWLLPICVSCDGGLKLVVVEQADLGAAATAATGGSSAGTATQGGMTSVIPQGGSSPQAGSGQSSAGGMGGEPDELPPAEGGAAGSPDLPFWDQPARYTASFSAYSFPDQYVRYIDNKAFIGPIDMASLAEQETASFEITPGLWDVSCSSFRAVNKIGAFLRHANSRVYLNPASDEPLFLADATFCEVPGLADPAGVTFRSSNYPERAIHLRNQNELWIDDVPAKDDVAYPDFAAQSTFYRQKALNETVSP